MTILVFIMEHMVASFRLVLVLVLVLGTPTRAAPHPSRSTFSNEIDGATVNFVRECRSR